MNNLTRLLPFLTALIVALAMLLATPTARAQEADDPPSEPPTIPDTPVGRELKWIMEALNGTDPDAKALAERMSDRMKEDTSPAELISSIKSVRENSMGGKKITLDFIDGEPTDYTVKGIIRGGRKQMSVFIVVDDKTGKLAGVRFGPAGYFVNDIGDWGGLDTEFQNMPGDISFGAYEIVLDEKAAAKDPNASPKPTMLYPIHQFGEEKHLGIASGASLFILGALGEQIAAGKLAWDERLPIKDDLKSLPSGVMQNFTAGEEHEIEEFAEKMLTASDNTASDHLAAKIGRDKIEAYFKRFSASPAKTMPFLRTLELFKLKLGDQDLAERFINGTEQEKRDILTGDGGELRKVKVDKTLIKTWTEPILIDHVEWFAGAEELGNLLLDLHRQEQVPTTTKLGEVLRKNRGMKLDEQVWKQVGYKGGSEPGVLNMNWLLQRHDDRWYILTVTWNDKRKVLEVERMFAMAQKGLDLLAKHGTEKPGDEKKDGEPKP